VIEGTGAFNIAYGRWLSEKFNFDKNITKIFRKKSKNVCKKAAKRQTRRSHHAEGLVNPKVRALKKGY
jgi:hypothetical protein